MEFDPFGCSVKDLPTQNKIVRYDSFEPLYPLQLLASALLASSASSLWHQHLRHPSHEVLSRHSSAISCNKTYKSASDYATLVSLAVTSVSFFISFNKYQYQNRLVLEMSYSTKSVVWM